MIEYRLRIRNRENTADALVITSVRNGDNPYLEGSPSGEGYQFDPLTGRSRAGVMRIRVIDAVNGADGAVPLRVFTQQLEDETQRWALPARLAMLDLRHDGGAWETFHPGSISQHTLTGGLVWDVAITDIAFATRKTEAFGPRRNPDPDQAAQGRLEATADYLARWPKRGCIIGGPVRGGVLSAPDLGGWRMRADTRNNAFADPTTSRDTYLRFVEGYGPPTFGWTRKPKDLWEAIEATVGRAGPSGYVNERWIDTVDRVTTGKWPNIVVEVMRTGLPTLYLAPTAGTYYAHADISEFFNAGDRTPGIFVRSSEEQLPLGSAIRVRAFDLLPSDRSPIYWTGHPIDLATALLDETDEVYGAASVETARAAIGAARHMTIRITELPDRQAFLENSIYGPFGIGIRPRAEGGFDFCATRIYALGAPTVELTAADIPRGEGGGFTGTTFDVAATTAVQEVVLEHDKLQPVQLMPESERKQYTDTPTDGVRVDQQYRIERKNGDPNAVAGDTVEYQIPGMLHLADATTPDTEGFLDVVALEIFDRWGRGIQASEHEVKFGTDAAESLLATELYNALPQLPNHNRRLGDDVAMSARAMQVVQRSLGSRGVHLRLLDSGPNAQPVPTRPVLAIAASADDPRTVAEVTITNAATLNAAGFGAQLEMAAPAAGVPVAGEFAAVLAYEPGQIPTTAIALPSVPSGRTVYAGGRSTSPEYRPSNRAVVVSVDLADLDAVTGLAVTPDAADGSLAVVSWTLPDADPHVIDVTVRETAADETETRRLPVLEAGSTQVTLERLTPGNAYTVNVTRRDPATGDVSAVATTAFVAGATAIALPTPAYPTPFAGRQGVGAFEADGVYGIAVASQITSGFVEVAEAVETAVGSGLYGAFALQAPVAVVQGDWTIWQATAPSDGLRRQLKARHTREGAYDSEYSDVVTVLPWSVVALPPYPTAAERQWELYDVRTERLSATEARVSWQRGDRVEWVFGYSRTLPTGSPFPEFTDADTPQFLGTGTDEMIVELPPVGMRTFVQLEARDGAFGILSDVVRQQLDPVTEPVRWSYESSEPSAGVGRVEVTLEDPGGFADAVRFRITEEGTTTDEAATLVTTSGTTSVYRKDVVLGLKHVVSVEAYVDYDDDSEDTINSWHFDTDKVAELTATVAYADDVATITAIADTDAAVGAGNFEYAVDGAAWVPLAMPADRVVTFDLTMSAAAKLSVAMRAKNAAAAYGPEFLLEVSQYVPASAPFAQCLAQLTSATETEITVTVTATAPDGAVPQVRLKAAPTGSATLASGPAAGVLSASGSVWVFSRGAFDAGPGQAVFEAVLTGHVADDDTIEIPEQGRDTVMLLVRARVIATSAADVTVRVSVADPYPQGADTATITYQDFGSGAVTPASGGTVTPASSLTEAAGTYIDYVIDRPAFSTGSGRVTFTASAANRIADADAIDIPAVEKTQFGPSLEVTPTPGSTSYSLAYTSDGTLTLSIDGGSYSVPAASPIVVARGASDKTYTFKCVKDGQTVTQSVVIPALATAITRFIRSVAVSGQSTATDIITVEWDAAENLQLGDTYNLLWRWEGGSVNENVGVTSPYSHQSGGTGGHGLDLSGLGAVGVMEYTVVVANSSVKVGQSQTIQESVDYL